MSPKRRKWPPRKASDAMVELARMKLQTAVGLGFPGMTLEALAKSMNVANATARQALEQLGAVREEKEPRGGRGALKDVWRLS